MPATFDPEATGDIVASDLTTAIFALTAEKDLPREVVIAAVEDALALTIESNMGLYPRSGCPWTSRQGHFTVWRRRRS